MLTAPTDVKWDISPEHFGEGNWTPATKNQWDWLIRIYYRRSESMEWEEVCKQSTANWCRNWTPLACAQRNGKLTSGEYAFTVTPRDKSNLYSDVKDIEGPESEKSSSLIYEKEYFQAKNLQWKDNTATVTWEKPSYVGDMTLTLYQKSEQGKDEPLYKCSVDTKTTSIDMSDYITQDGTYYCIMENKNSLFLNNGCVTSKTAEYTISGENLPNVEGLQWRAGESDIGCVEWNAPNSSEENYGGYAVTLYKGEDKVTTIHTDAKTATADLYPYFTGDGNYSFTVRTTHPGAKNIMGAESGKCSYIFNSSNRLCLQ